MPPPWISVETEILEAQEPQVHNLEQGQRQYYFACGFTDPGNLEAEITGPDGYVEKLTVLSTVPEPDRKLSNAQGVVVWNAILDVKPEGDIYTLKMWDGKGQAELTISLHPTPIEQILVAPYPSGPAGTTFEVYYCGYEAGTVVVDLYYVVKSANPEDGYDYFHTDSWDVIVNSGDCVKRSLQSLPGDPARTYYLDDREAALDGFDYFWLTP